MELTPLLGQLIFDFAQLKKASNDFSEILGRGGFGIVYKGIVTSSMMPVYIDDSLFSLWLSPHCDKSFYRGGIIKLFRRVRSIKRRQWPRHAQLT